MNRLRPIPLIRLYGNLILPIQGELEDEIVSRLTADVTEAIERGSVSGLIIDLTGVELMDTYVTRCIRDLALAARVMGVPTVVSGMRWVVVVTLVEMGLTIPGVRSAMNLERALELLAPEPREPREPFERFDEDVADEVPDAAEAELESY